MALLDEIRAKAQEKKDEIAQNEPERLRFAELMVEFFGNTDYIREAAKSTTMHGLYFMGYELSALDDLYQRLMEEINRRYRVISPEDLARLMKEKEKADLPDQG